MRTVSLFLKMKKYLGAHDHLPSPSGESCRHLVIYYTYTQKEILVVAERQDTRSFVICRRHKAHLNEVHASSNKLLVHPSKSSSNFFNLFHSARELRSQRFSGAEKNPTIWRACPR